MRGGTSRGAFFHAADLPRDAELRERVILAVYGSPDVRQIDGIGGADPLTSKVAIVAPSTRSDADVDFTFGQVRITEAVVDFTGTAGTSPPGSRRSPSTRVSSMPSSPRPSSAST